jgi:hypothetical protein
MSQYSPIESHGSRPVFKYQVYEIATGAAEGDLPYRYVGRALMRVQWLNGMAQELRFTLKPVRVRE